MIRTVLDTPDARDRIGANGRRRVMDHWSWRHTAERTVEQYRELLTGPSSDARSGSLPGSRSDLLSGPRR
jgi:hypothetical protein